MPALAEAPLEVHANMTVEHPAVGTGTKVQYLDTWESGDRYVPASVLEHFGNGQCTLEIQDRDLGVSVVKHGCRYIDDPFTKTQLYKENVLDLGDGGMWKATDDQAAILTQLRDLSDRVGGLEVLRDRLDALLEQNAPKSKKKPEHTVDVDNRATGF